MHEFVTIFIPTHNRHGLLMRNLVWLEQSGCQIVIADSSNTSFELEVDRLNSGSGHKGNILYFHMNNIDYYTKIVSALKAIKTTFTIMCPDDDFIIWKNIKYLVAEAVKSNAQTVVARDLSLKECKNGFDIEESSEYRKFGIKSQDNLLLHLKSAMSPIVCTYYQLHKTSMLLDLWSHMEKNKSLMPGNKLAEIVFRSGCFINGPVVFCDKIFRVLGYEPPLRSYDKSKAIQRYILNFSEEVRYLQDNGIFKDFVNIIASYINKHHPGLSHKSNEIALNFIINPMFRRMKSKHEILWKSRYSLGFDFSSDKDMFVRSNESLKYVFGISNDSYRLPEYFMNLESYFLSDESEWNNLIRLLSFLNKHKLEPL
ncbi:TIGR00180 family glycosyltransferase [Synechococcus sp. CC9616]|uniref:TIGR00180 family glycosyltransferase n=1 Tax=Synechococcus sp. CC9616 TaxID=110663 RepID=UPI00090723D2|nr:TIGR00180 family glycosyltransferase [Synechococcus sp. CC9616]